MRVNDKGQGPPPSRRRVPTWSLVGFAIAVWAALPPVTPPDLNTEFVTEVVDHMIPAALVLIGLGLAMAGGAYRGLAGASIVTIMGLFMVATHVPLVVQATTGGVDWAPTIHHSVPGLAVTGLGIWLVTKNWSAAAPEDQSSG